MIHSFPLELKSITDSGLFEGIASVYGETDLGNDCVDVGAFSKTLADAGRTRPLLWQHESPIGLVSLTDTPTALLVSGKLSMALQSAKDTLVLMRDGVCKGLSIGYQTVRESYVGEVRHLQEVKLWECSLTPFPMLPSAQVTSIKSRTDQQIAIALKSFRMEILSALSK